MPDFDVDFCIKGRERVIDYVRHKYDVPPEEAEGKPPEENLKVAQIITFGKMKSKAVIRDVGRVLAIPYGDVDAIAKLVPNVLNVTLKEAFELEPEFQRLREACKKILRGVGIETGGCNVQFALDPKSDRFVVIEMNPRVSRSSALASKATGFPIAKLAALVAVGYSLDEIDNDITKKTPASIDTLPSHPYNAASSLKVDFSRRSPSCRSLLSSPRISSASGNMDFGSA
jgi:hypothetical protein